MSTQPPAPQGPGAPVPPPPGGSAPGGPAPGASLGADLGASLSFVADGVARGWRGLLLPAAVYGAIALCLDILGAVNGDDDTTGLLELQGVADAIPDWLPIALAPAQLLLGIAYLVIQLLWSAGTLRFGADLLRGGPQEPSRYFVGDGRVILTILICGVLTAIGFVLCVIPGLVAMVVLLLAPAASARGAGSPLSVSSRLTGARLGTVLLACLITVAASSLGSQLNVLSIALTPFSSLFLLGLLERLEGRALPR